MPNQKISELTAIVTVDNSVDVLPIVDISANTTKKVTPNALKTALALDNVNNTSDANKPVSIAQQDALNAKVDENAPITAGTAPKITYDAKGLVTSGDSLDETDLPTGINANKIGTGAVSSTEFGYLDGVTSAIQTQIDSKQATLVSGTSIKTINSTSLLGSGDITISANPSGVAGAIQFSNGSAFASDASNLFWDDTNNRLGVGTNAPSATGHFKGSGSTSATTALLVQNSAGTASFQIKDDGNSYLGQFNTASGNNALDQFTAKLFTLTNAFVSHSVGSTYNGSTGDSSLALCGLGVGGGFFGGIRMFTSSSSATPVLAMIVDRNQSVGIGLTNSTDLTVNASAKLQVDSTTKGFLPPRMTTTQKNAIASPATGLVLYDSTTNKLQCYNGSTWNDLF
jgi:hypothetical protein